jgi:hypothetical protein
MKIPTSKSSNEKKKGKKKKILVHSAMKVSRYMIQWIYALKGSKVVASSKFDAPSICRFCNLGRAMALPMRGSALGLY